ncbi:molybdopterin-guanine dinucleotide biosynthesis protein B [Desulfurivibrio alkaliphilus]|uniref:Molybdopterin-guanine dinucleotide biosynthesis protein B n=1 Tax=Desulfurivibrio alkaliphilus (strain DSM 19089 / UNIQEM U267 / AHT2) TaxID=589865 RepID=D6Z519_DESAT|nr:molybdopterin-guanine dinucleotide biosynthesis protein B [Desulfurivibrio alkaliphilus]ADH86644.1 molybdopterin-guanine dinucleotide biosynthesis protein B [Desulfurivibrio alkaliphilus AHT 2]
MTRIPVVAVVGMPDCGKTTLLEKLLPELKGRGLKVGTIKHHVHEFTMDTPGKDTWRHKQAGADAVVLASPTGIGLVRDTDRDLGVDELVTRYLNDADLVLAEGYKHTRLPKIEVYRAELHPSPLPGRDATWLAMVSADPPANLGLPSFAPDQIKELADFLEDHLRQAAKQATPTGRSYIHLEVDGQPVPLNRFAASLLRRGIKGMIASLRGCERPRKISLNITEGHNPDDHSGNHAD